MRALGAAAAATAATILHVNNIFVCFVKRMKNHNNIKINGVYIRGIDRYAF